jgi:hypothetical protein
MALWVGAGTAHASPITLFSDRTSWEAAVATVISTTTFEENGSGGFTFHDTSATFDGATYVVDAGFLFTVDPDFACPGYCEIGTGDVLSAQAGATVLSVSGGGVTALAFDFLTWSGSTLPITLSTGEVLSLPTVPFVAGFFGITSTVPITGIGLTVTDVLNLDNVSVVAAVPEPGTLLMLTGLAAVGARRRLRRPSR